MERLRRYFALFLTLVLVLSMTACTTGGEQEDENLRKVTFVLDWTPNTNHTGLYVAIANGYFAEAGLEVEVVQPPEGGAEMLVGTGKAQFGVSCQDSMAPALAGDEPLPITAVAAVIQHNTSGIISRKGEGMDTPKGLEGHKYATWDAPVEKATIRQVMEAEGGNFDQVELIPSTVTDEVSALQSGSVDAIWVYYAWAGVACEVAGLETDYFAFADLDPIFDFYTPVIIAGNQFLQDDPETVRAFMEALSRGYTYATEHPREAADILMEAAPELQSNKELVYASQEYLAGEYIAEVDRWGEIDPERWAGFYTWLDEQNLLTGELNPEAGFSNDYLPEE